MENYNSEPMLIKGGFAVDERGKVSFCNDFNFKDVKRFYVLENLSTSIIRAFHGHLIEAKYIFVISGSAIVCIGKFNPSEKTGEKENVHRFVLSSKEPSVLYVPGGFANGSRFLEDNTKIIVFSTSSLQDSKNDDYQLPYDYWGKDIWEYKK